MSRPRVDILVRGKLGVVTAGVGVLLFLAFAGCGGAGRGGRDSNVTRPIVVEGRVSLRGSTPFRLLFLETLGGEAYMVRSSPVADELERLEGMFVTVEGSLLPVVSGEPPVITVHSYALLPFASGEQPIVGRLEVEGDECRLLTTDGEHLVVTGEFASILKGLGGAKVWVIGPVSAGEGRAKTIDVKGYQVIGPPR